MLSTILLRSCLSRTITSNKILFPHGGRQASGRTGTDPPYTRPLLDERSAGRLVARMSTKERQVLMEVLRRLEQVTPSPSPAQISAAVPTAAPSGPSPTPRPSNRELYQLAFYQSLPFVGFGFLDNLIMILAGEYIDHTIGLTLGISTMAAAALGNTISDVFGVGSAWYVEHWSLKLGVGPPPLTLEQMELPSSRISANLGRAVGVVVGCLLGMAPLIF